MNPSFGWFREARISELLVLVTLLRQSWQTVTLSDFRPPWPISQPSCTCLRQPKAT